MADCGTGFARFFLMSLNLIFVLLGLGLLIAGALFKFGTDMMQEDILKVMNEIPTTIVGDVDVGNLLLSLSLLFIIIGVFILIVGVLGFCGACYRSRPLLIMYAIIVGIILIIQIVGVVLFTSMQSDMNSYMEKGFNELFKSYNASEGDEGSRYIDVFFHQLECCGYNNATDITKHTDWNYEHPNFKIPQGCCRSYDTTTKDTNSTEMRQCLQNPTDENSYSKGCHDKITSLIEKYGAAFLYVGIVIIAVETACIIFALCVCCQNDRNKSM